MSKTRRAVFVTSIVVAFFATSSFGQWATSGTNIYNTNSGNVGIGTSAPAAKLDVNGSITLSAAGGGMNTYTVVARRSGGALNFPDIMGTGGLVLANSSSPTTQLAMTSIFALTGGFVGIGTAAPQGLLTVAGGQLILKDYSGSVGGQFQMYNATNDSGFMFRNTGAPGQSRLSFTKDVVDVMVIDNTGAVGIGTNTPTAKLDVRGDINVTGNIAAKYQDVAEWVASSEPLTAGTVVVLNPDRSNEVMASSAAYDTKVAGVVSSHPGLILGESSASKEKIATTGRVKARVDASNAPINVGDLLVTSPKSGVAMKSLPIDIGGVKIHRPGTIIGKALEPLASGEAEILVLLSLQ